MRDDEIKVKEKIMSEKEDNIENSFGESELKLLNLIAELIVEKILNIDNYEHDEEQ